MQKPLQLRNSHCEQQLNEALQQAADNYFADCRARIPAFAKKHFRYPGAWHTNKVAFGWDLLRMPFNLLWAPIYLLLQLFGLLTKKIGWQRLATLIRKTPAGFTTQVQRNMVEAINLELLGNAPHTPENHFHQYIIKSIKNSSLLNNQKLDTQILASKIEIILNDALEQYAVTRTASADITNTALSTAVGALMLKKFTPGGLCFGFIIAATVAKFNATGDFFLGETLGGVYYSLFPPEPSLTLSLVCTVGVMCFLAVIASFSGLLSDPIQYHTGLHQFRLKKLLTHLAQDFARGCEATFKPKDQYLARLMEVLDAIRAQL